MGIIAKDAEKSVADRNAVDTGWSHGKGAGLQPVTAEIPSILWMTSEKRFWDVGSPITVTSLQLRPAQMFDK